MGTIFSKIYEGKAEGVILWEDEQCLVLMDAFPMLPGHLLLIPKVEQTHLNRLSDELSVHLFRQVPRLTRALEKAGLSDGDANVLLNDGRSAGQTVPHVHIHVVPRRRGDAFPFPALFTNLGRKLLRRRASLAQLERIAEQLRRHL